MAHAGYVQTIDLFQIFPSLQDGMITTRCMITYAGQILVAFLGCWIQENTVIAKRVEPCKKNAESEIR